MEFDVNKAIAYFQDVITNHFADFSGRVSRKDYWTYIAIVIGVLIVAAILQGILGFGIAALIQLALLLPNAGMTARRLQDMGKSGSLVWILMIPVLVSSLVTLLLTMAFGVFGLILFFLPLMGLINLIALAAAIYIIYLCIQPGTAGSNQYGPEPASAT